MLVSKPTWSQDKASRVWTPADRAAGVIPITALRYHGSEAMALVIAGRRLTVLKHGRPAALLVPLYGEKLDEAPR